jgi:hypothetical protein
MAAASMAVDFMAAGVIGASGTATGVVVGGAIGIRTAATDSRRKTAGPEWPGRSIEGRREPPYCPAIISKGDTQVTAGSWMFLHFGHVNTCMPDSRLPSAERQSETAICHELTQEFGWLQ